jgi:hypothetical protein
LVSEVRSCGTVKGAEMARKGCGDVEGPKRVRLEEESRKAKPRRRGADLRIPDGRFAENRTPECGVKFHAWISSSTVGPRKSPRKVQVSRDVDRPVTIKATVIEKKIVFAKPARRFRRVYGVSPQPFRRGRFAAAVSPPVVSPLGQFAAAVSPRLFRC